MLTPRRHRARRPPTRSESEERTDESDGSSCCGTPFTAQQQQQQQQQWGTATVAPHALGAAWRGMGREACEGIARAWQQQQQQQQQREQQRRRQQQQQQRQQRQRPPLSPTSGMRVMLQSVFRESQGMRVAVMGGDGKPEGFVVNAAYMSEVQRVRAENARLKQLLASLDAAATHHSSEQTDCVQGDSG